MLKTKRLLCLILTLLLLIISGLSIAGEEPESFVIIVNKSNNVSSLSKSQASRMFLKKVFTWKDGEPVRPVELIPNHNVRQKFSEEVHGRNVYSIKNYWQQMIFAGRDVPPLEKETEKEIIEYVSSKPNAIGYVSPNANLEKVKVLQIIN